ncbi:kinase-like domain-containing protein, partial [Panaeolus papilionaceus]
MTTNLPFLDQYEPLDVIGNGSFGIIRKVKRKSDGTILARKELNFERMSERDRKQIVAEVNILKELNHDHIVRYHDRYVDRDAGILYILMEYCGGGDLSTIIKTATKQGRLIPEDTIWNYFLQILLALQHCHHPNISGTKSDAGGSRRAQILHRDLKPDNVFLDENNTVKLGDFGLSKALAQASFANTYVGTPYYMSPELMQEKAYDSKSDIWSLGCLIYELCAHKPPFHEAKTHSELSIFIRNGRIPPLPRGYSQALNAVIRSMLNLNPAMRPSAAQLLQHERLELVFKVAETEKMLSIVKSHRSNLANKEREMLAREHAIAEKERQLATILHSKEDEITSLQHMLGYSQQDVDVAIKNAIARREAELRVLVAHQEEQVATAMSIREEEIMEAVRQREREVGEAWMKREEELRGEIVEREEEMVRREEEFTRMEDELARREEELTKKEAKKAGGRREKGGVFEEVKNTLPSEESNTRQGMETPVTRSAPATTDINSIPSTLSNPSNLAAMPPASAMKGVVFTATGQVLATPLPAVIPMSLATPSPAEIGALFEKSPKVGLGFAKIFDF